MHRSTSRQSIQKTCTADMLKPVLVWERVNAPMVTADVLLRSMQNRKITC